MPCLVLEYLDFKGQASHLRKKLIWLTILKQEKVCYCITDTCCFYSTLQMLMTRENIEENNYTCEGIYSALDIF